MKAKIVVLPDGTWAGKIVEDKEQRILILASREDLLEHLGFHAKDVRRMNELHALVDGSTEEIAITP